MPECISIYGSKVELNSAWIAFLSGCATTVLLSDLLQLLFRQLKILSFFLLLHFTRTRLFVPFAEISLEACSFIACDHG